MPRVTLILHKGRVDYAFSDIGALQVTVLDFDAVQSEPADPEAALDPTAYDTARIPIDLVTQITHGTECCVESFTAEHDPHVAERAEKLAQDTALRAARRLEAEAALLSP